jgi:hypothetical protein
MDGLTKRGVAKHCLEFLPYNTYKKMSTALSAKLVVGVHLHARQKSMKTSATLLINFLFETSVM